MSGPLDDALRAHDAEHEMRRRRADAATSERAARVRRFAELVEEFARRMNAVGNPGTDWEMKVGFRRTVRGWALTYESGDAWRRVPIRVDGLVPAPSFSDPYVRPEASDYALDDRQFAELAKSMAEVMRRFDVT